MAEINRKNSKICCSYDLPHLVAGKLRKQSNEKPVCSYMYVPYTLTSI